MRWTHDQLAEYQGRQGRVEVPVSKGTTPTEDVEHMAVARYLDALGLFWLHIPNEGKRSKVAGARLKAMGMKAGASDFLIFDAPPLHPCAKGLALELKRAKGGKVSASQSEFLESMEQRGWLATVAHGANEAVDYLRSLGWRMSSG